MSVKVDFCILCVALLMDLLSCVLCCVCFCMSEVISSFKSMRAGSHVFALLMVSFCVIVHTLWSCKNMQLLCIFLFGMLCLSAISMMFVKIMLSVCMLVDMVV